MKVTGTIEQTQKALDLTMDRFTVTLWQNGIKVPGAEKDFCFFETAREWIIRNGYWYDQTPTSAYPSPDSVVNFPDSKVKTLRFEGAQPK